MSDTANLLERYLAAVGRYLPARGREDTLAELRANLLAEFEDKAAALDRSLTGDEQADLLRAHGQPVIVATRYYPRRQLIGPELFPFYSFTLRRFLPFVFALVVLAQAIAWIYVPSLHRTAAQWVVGLFAELFYFWARVTLVFAAVDLVRNRYPAWIAAQAAQRPPWDPRKLPNVVPQQHRDLPKNPVADLLFSAAFTVLLLVVPRYPYLLLGPGALYLDSLSIHLAPVWHTFYWAAVVFNCVQLFFKGMAFLPSMQPLVRPMRLIERLGGLVLSVILLRTGEYLVLAAPGTTPDRHQLVAALNLNTHRAIQLVVVIAVLRLIWDTGQIIRRSWHPDQPGVPHHG